VTLQDRIKIVDNYYLNNDCTCEIGNIDGDYELCDTCKCASILNNMADELEQFMDNNNHLFTEASP